MDLSSIKRYSVAHLIRPLPAKERKRIAQIIEEARLKKRMEDASWEETDKRILRKMQRRAERERKNQERQNRRNAARELFEQESTANDKENAERKEHNKNKSYEWVNDPIYQTQEEEEGEAKTRKKKNVTNPEPLEENLNRVYSSEEEEELYYDYRPLGSHLKKKIRRRYHIFGRL